MLLPMARFVVLAHAWASPRGRGARRPQEKLKTQNPVRNRTYLPTTHVFALVFIQNEQLTIEIHRLISFGIIKRLQTNDNIK